MGETNNPEGDVKTSTGAEGLTSEKETPTLTESQAKAREAKARSDALSDLGRLKKAAEDARKVAEAAINRLQEREEQDLKREEEAAQGDPEKLSAIRLRREANKAKAEAEEERRKLEVDRADIQTQRQEVLQHHADRLSEKYNVDASTLLKYGGDNKASLEELAKSYGERAGESKKGRMTSPPDSGKTKGAPGSQTLEQLMAKDVKKMTYPEKLEHKKALEEATKATRSAT